MKEQVKLFYREQFHGLKWSDIKSMSRQQFVELVLSTTGEKELQIREKLGSNKWILNDPSLLQFLPSNLRWSIKASHLMDIAMRNDKPITPLTSRMFHEKQNPKFFFDASFAQGTGGIGVVAVRPETKKCIYITKRKPCFDSMEGEYLAMYEAVQFAVTLQPLHPDFSCVDFITDCKELADVFNSLQFVPRKYEMHYCVTRRRMFKLKACTVQWIPRCKNTAADYVAQETLKNKGIDLEELKNLVDLLFVDELILLGPGNKAFAMKLFVEAMVSSICYGRSIFPKSCFTDWFAYGIDNKMKKLIDVDPLARNLLNWMRKGVFDALQKEYLETLLFCICETMEGPMIEEYSFSFSYSSLDKQEVSMEISWSENKNQGETFNCDSTSEVSSTEFRSSPPKMLSTLVQLMRRLGKMPEERVILMKLLYYDDMTPEDYEPPCFRCCSTEEGYSEWTKNPWKVEVGDVQIKHVVLALKAKSVLDRCDNDAKDDHVDNVTLGSDSVRREFCSGTESDIGSSREDQYRSDEIEVGSSQEDQWKHGLDENSGGGDVLDTVICSQGKRSRKASVVMYPIFQNVNRQRVKDT